MGILLALVQTRCQRLEGENADLRAAAVEKEVRAEKYRKAYKDMGEPTAAAAVVVMPTVIVTLSVCVCVL